MAMVNFSQIFIPGWQADLSAEFATLEPEEVCHAYITCIFPTINDTEQCIISLKHIIQVQQPLDIS